MSKQLDFSGLNKIAFKGFEEQPEERDSLLEAGYTFVDTPTPFEAPSAQPSAPETPSAPPEPERDYKRLYRIAFDFQQRHNPPTVDREYWHTRIPGVDDTPKAEEEYWLRLAEDAGKTSASADNDPFLMDLLTAIMADFEREYKRLRETA